MAEAVKFLTKVEKRGEINLEYWDILSDEVIIHDKFLIRKKGKKQKAHIWTRKDTSCKMWSTGGLNSLSGAYSLFNSCMEKEICTMCVNNQHKNC
ncbi:hypothetical protein VB712_04310 [Spirulina sp. CCNP1310]|nr:hypothetical protein [Spirulina sp. CCNP1310]